MSKSDNGHTGNGANPASNGSDKQAERRFGIQKLYVKDVSFEAPGAPRIFTEKWEPSVTVELNTQGETLAEGVYDVRLSVTITTKVQDKTAFLVEVEQGGVFDLAGFPDAERNAMLGSYCPNILFPFAREVVADLVTKGGFPPLLLAPVNFDQLYAQHQQKQEAQSDAAAAPQGAVAKPS